MFIEQAFFIFTVMEFKENPKEIGVIQKTHGVHGGLVIQTYADLADDMDIPKWVFVELEGNLVPYKLVPEESFIRDSKHIVIFVDGIGTPEQGKRLLHASICFPGEFVKAEKSGSGLSISKGYQVSFEGRTEIGLFIEMMDIPGNPLMSIDVEGKEILVPANEEFVISQDDGTKKIHLRIPDELLDLN